MSHALRAHDEKAEIRYADFRNEVLAARRLAQRSLHQAVVVDPARHVVERVTTKRAAKLRSDDAKI